MVIIYSPISSARLTYTVNLLVGLIPGLNYEITADKDVFLARNAAKINYSNDFIEGALNITPAGLLWETGIHPVEPAVGQWQGYPTLFANGGEMPFDILSGVFFMVSRYEEYTDSHRDHHSRYTAPQSIAHKKGFLHLPVINIWAHHLRLLLNERFGLQLPPATYRFVPTLDIDQAFYYKHRPWWRSILAAGRQLSHGNFAGAFIRGAVVAGLHPDPNFNFDVQEKMHRQNKATPVYFFHVGNGGRHDPWPLYKVNAVWQLIKRLSSAYPVGIHPSYDSFLNEGSILAEKLRLEGITGQPVTKSRQHYLRFALPQTYRQLVNCGISDEYSMGYAETTGYRAGIAAPFEWFDLEKNEATRLTVHPFAVMDVTLKNYMKLSVEEAMATIDAMAATVKQYGGTFMSLWHNESLGEYGEWKNWRKVYEGLLAKHANYDNRNTVSAP